MRKSFDYIAIRIHHCWCLCHNYEEAIHAWVCCQACPHCKKNILLRWFKTHVGECKRVNR